MTYRVLFLSNENPMKVGKSSTASFQHGLRNTRGDPRCQIQGQGSLEVSVDDMQEDLVLAVCVPQKV